MSAEAPSAPNHHAHYPYCTGLPGLIAATTMVFGRSGEARLAADLARLTPADVVVDVGCGPGAAARHAARQGATVIGVDPAMVMLRVARTLTRSRAVRFTSGSAERVPLPDGAASIVWTIASVHHWSDIDAGLEEVRRLLRPGGRFVAIEKHTQAGAHGLASHGWTDEQAHRFAATCVSHGLTTPTVAAHAAAHRPAISVTAVREETPMIK